MGPYTVVTRGTKICTPLTHCALLFFCQMNRDLEKTCCSSITWPFFQVKLPKSGIHKLRCFLHFDIVFPIPFLKQNLYQKFLTIILKIVFYWCKFCKLHRQNPHVPPPPLFSKKRSSW